MPIRHHPPVLAHALQLVQLAGHLVRAAQLVLLLVGQIEEAQQPDLPVAQHDVLQRLAELRLQVGHLGGDLAVLLATLDGRRPQQHQDLLGAQVGEQLLRLRLDGAADADISGNHYFAVCG